MTIRDFLYLDADFLRSISSQLSGGVTNSFSETESDSFTEIVERTGLSLKKEPREEKANFTGRSESRIYHDHEFTMMERKLASSLLTIADQASPSLLDLVEEAFLIRVTGRSYIEDYARLTVILQNFEKISAALAQAQQGTDEHKALIAQTEETLRGMPDGPDKVLLGTRLRELKDPKKRSGKEVGKLIESLKVFVDVFRRDALELTINSSGVGYNFVSVLNPEWLRVAPDRLRRLYGTRTRFQFTVVGQVTYLPGGDNSLAVATSPADMDSEASMGDAMRIIVNSTAEIESSFTQSSLGREIVLRPLAVYRESEIAEPEPIEP